MINVKDILLIVVEERLGFAMVVDKDFKVFKQHKDLDVIIVILIYVLIVIIIKYKVVIIFNNSSKILK